MDELRDSEERGFNDDGLVAKNITEFKDGSRWKIAKSFSADLSVSFPLDRNISTHSSIKRTLTKQLSSSAVWRYVIKYDT